MIRFENRNVNTAIVYSFPHQPVAMAVFICTLCLCTKAPFHRNRKGAWEILWSSTRSWGPGPAGGRASSLRSTEASWLLVDAATCHRWRMKGDWRKASVKWRESGGWPWPSLPQPWASEDFLTPLEPVGCFPVACVEILILSGISDVESRTKFVSI